MTAPDPGAGPTAVPAADVAGCAAAVREPTLAAAIAATRRLRQDRGRDGLMGAARRLLRGGGEPAPPVAVAVDLGELWLPAYDQVVLPWLREYGTWEPEEAATFAGLLREGMTVLDLGGHVGYFTILASRRVGPEGRVIAFEPEPGNFDLLCRNLQAHGCDNVRPLPVAAWEHTQMLGFTVSADNSGGHQVAAAASGSVRSVPAVAIDEVLGDLRVDVVKADVQGADHRALRGAAATLARDHPDLLVEFWPPGIRDLGDDPLAVLGEYRGLGYELTEVLPPVVDPGASPDTLLAATEATPEGFVSLLLRHPLRASGR